LLATETNGLIASSTDNILQELDSAAAAADNLHQPGFSLFTATFYALQTMAYHRDDPSPITIKPTEGSHFALRRSTLLFTPYSGLWQYFSRHAGLILHPDDLTPIISHAWSDILTDCGRFFFSLDGDPVKFQDRDALTPFMNDLLCHMHGGRDSSGDRDGRVDPSSRHILEYAVYLDVIRPYESTGRPVSIYVGSATDRKLGVSGRILDYEHHERRRQSVKFPCHLRALDAPSTSDNMFFALARLPIPVSPEDVARNQNLIRIIEAAAIMTLRLRGWCPDPRCEFIHDLPLLGTLC
jgi:hypothetical protein